MGRHDAAPPGAPDERAACPENADAQGEQACVQRCVGSVGRADQALLEAAASYFQALTVYCGAILAKAAQ